MAFSRRLKVILVLSAVLIAVQAINSITGNSLLHFGIMPRSLIGLRGIVFAPFLHGSIQHLLSNLLPFIVLSWLVATEGVRRYAWVAGLICLLGGLMVWSFGRSNIHVGASGLIFGLWAYLLAGVVSAQYRQRADRVAGAGRLQRAGIGLRSGGRGVVRITYRWRTCGRLCGLADALQGIAGTEVSQSHARKQCAFCA